ncbi:DNA topoisomerase [Lachnoclostridium sp. Marseille-P6806]|uniref:DNA topoisomerase n=1 Tax=Lachnoclostridium sp. Marseille-P6806 TaxID=2364793 RepID=UPI0010322A0E|nr:DNA topoisomerase [Lachnoclostridium sp. Marseille-P6806]
MGKRVFIAEKPSVARQFADALELRFVKKDGFMESADGGTLITWCVGHLVSMSYPDAYDEKYRKWSLDTIPFVPAPGSYRYQVIEDVRKQFSIVSGLLCSPDVDTIYICTDSGREGEYIYRLVAEKAGVRDKRQLRVWIDSQTKEEILRGIREAKDDAAYDALGASAYLRAKEDYLMGINFSRALTLRYGSTIRGFLGTDRCVIAVGRVMTCVLGMVVGREREIRSFVRTSFYRVLCLLETPDGARFQAEWHSSEGSVVTDPVKLYNEKGFRKREDAEELIRILCGAPDDPPLPAVDSVTRKKETKNPPLLYNLAELQNDCSRFFKISPDDTLKIAQELYEKKLTTYPRTDARVLSSAVAKEITKNLNGLYSQPMYKAAVAEIAVMGSAQKIAGTRYTDDKAITDHYAIIPTGQGFSALSSCSETAQKVYELIVRRFLAVFYPAAVFDKISMQIRIRTELFSASVRSCREEGYQKVMQFSFSRGREDEKKDDAERGDEFGENELSGSLSARFAGLKKGNALSLQKLDLREGETKPPSRYNSGSMILAMENAGQLIEDEELREQIRGSGIGTSATRAGILTKLEKNRYLSLNKKTQIITPTQLGEMICDTVSCSLRPLLDPRLTASWEKGLTGVAGGEVSEDDYMTKLTEFVVRRTNHVKDTDYRDALNVQFRHLARFYPEKPPRGKGSGSSGKSSGRGSGKTGRKHQEAK